MRFSWSRLAVIAALVLAGAAMPAQAQQLKLQLESREVYADLPFVLALTAEGSLVPGSVHQLTKVLRSWRPS